MKIKICSVSHFERLCKSFWKNSFNFTQNESRLSVYKGSFRDFYYGYPESYYGNFDLLLNKLKNTFKHNPYKTSSKYNIEEYFYINNDLLQGARLIKFWISYTIEDENCKRVKDNNFKDKFIVFKIYTKVENHRKKRLYRWKVKMDWIK